MSASVRRARTGSRTARRSASAGLVLAAVVAGAGLSTTAMAAPSDYTVLDRQSGGVTADVLPTTQIDGVAWDQEIVGNTVYAGGEFANARPAGAAAGTNLTPRANLLAYDITTGNLRTDFRQDTNAAVNVIAKSPDGSRIYIGGAFTTVGGQPRYRIAAINTADGSLVGSFQPQLDASVNAIVVTDQAVYVGGVFSRANGTARTRLAAFDPTNGALLGWAPTANRNVRAMTTSPDGSRIIVGGQFSTLNGFTATGTGSLDATTGALYSFGLNRVVRNGTDNTGVFSLQSDGTNVVATAFNYGEGMYEGVAMADATTGAVKWLADCHGDSYDATVMNRQVYSVSHHHNCENIGSFPQIDDVTFKRANAFSYDATGTVRTNLQSGYSNFGGNPAPSQIDWYPELVAGTYTGQSQAAWTAESNDKYLVLGGEFPKVHGIAQQGLVRFAVPGVAPAKTGPVVGGSELAPRVSVRGTSATLTWKASWDRDNKNLEYQVFRSDNPTTPVGTIKSDSLWWDRPTLSYTDTTMAVGQSYTYWIVAVDPDGNKAKSTEVSATAGTPVAADVYANAVMADQPTHVWRLGETSGRTAQDSVGNNPLSLGTDVYRNYAGILAGDAATRFAGTSWAYAGSQSAEAITGDYTAEAWFKTTTTSGGVILNQGNYSYGTSTITDREIYMTNAGTIGFSYYSEGARRFLLSSGRYNDGRWHHVATSVTNGARRLYVDGAPVATATNYTTGSTRPAYWRVGGDAKQNLASAPYSQWFNGTIDEVAVYNKALGDAAVRSHAAAGGANVANTAPVAAMTVTCDGATCSVDGNGSTDAESAIKSYEWDFGDGTKGTGATATHTYKDSGARTITLTVTDDAGLTSTASKQVSISLPNQAPVAAFTQTLTGMDLAVDGSESTDDGLVERYEWDFGDGTTATGAKASHTYTAPGTYTVTLTVTDDAGTRSSTTRQAVVLADGQMVGQDAFDGTRTRWGAATLGGDWTYVSGANAFSTKDGVGVMTLNAGTLANATLAGATGTDTLTSADVTIDRTTTGGGVNVMLAGRRNGSSDYRAKLRLLSDGSARIGIARVVGGTETVLKEAVVAGGYTPGQTVHVTFGIAGTGTTTLTAKAWTGDAEPANPTVSVTDSTAELQAAGATGVVGYASGSATNAPFTVGVSNLTVVRKA